MRYATLLVALAALLVLAPPLAATGRGSDVGFLLSLAVLCAGAAAASEPPRLRSPAVLLLPLPLLAEGLVRLAGTTPVLVAARLASGAYLITVAAVLLRHVLVHRRSSADAVFGGICVYLLLGVVFYTAFCAVEVLAPGSFLVGGAALVDVGGAAAPLGRYPDLLYYSFVTLTTLGYGDVLPMSPFARSLAAAEAVVGQLYLAVLVAGLLGLYLAERGER